VLVADVGFDFSTLPVSLNLRGLIAKLDLSADPAANTLDLKLSDVLALPSANRCHSGRSQRYGVLERCRLV
jgi:hypothetical protein